MARIKERGIALMIQLGIAVQPVHKVHHKPEPRDMCTRKGTCGINAAHGLHDANHCVHGAPGSQGVTRLTMCGPRRCLP
eukprot:3002247-Alexandrium_andersonii.AAC.1